MIAVNLLGLPRFGSEHAHSGHAVATLQVAIALAATMASAVTETNCIDSSGYRSPKLGLACAQHKDLDCREFGVVGYSKDDIDDLLRQCPSSCAVEGCTAATEIVQVSAQRSRSLRGLQPTNAVSTCPAEWDETCRDDPNFISKLHLPCSSHVTFECSVLHAIGFSLQDIDDLISSCPCSCNIECSAHGNDSDPPTASPVSDPPTALLPTLHPTIALTFSIPAKIATESPSVSPSVESQDIQNAIAVAIISEEPTQNQNDDSALGSLPKLDFLPFSSSTFYGIIAAAIGLVIIVGLVGYRREKASSRRDHNNDEIQITTSSESSAYQSSSSPSRAGRSNAHQSRPSSPTTLKSSAYSPYQSRTPMSRAGPESGFTTSQPNDKSGDNCIQM